MKTNHLLIMLILSIAVSIIGCKKTTHPVDTDKTMDDIVVPEGFTYELSAERSLTIIMPASLEFENLRSRFDVYTADPLEGGKLVTSGSFDENGEFYGNLKLPTTLTQIFVKTIAGSVVVNLSYASTNNREEGVIIDFGEDYGYNDPDTLDDVFKTSHISNIVSSIKQVKSVESNLISNGDFAINDFGIIDDYDDTHPVDGKWYKIKDHDKVMEWYDDSGNKVVRSPFADKKYYGGVSQMTNASPGDVITLSADIKRLGDDENVDSYLYLIARKANGHKIHSYNLKYKKPTDQWVNKTLVVTMPNNTAFVQVYLYVKDKKKDYSVCFDNVVVTGPVTDSDGDGVDDDLDDYPNDASRAFDVYYPNDTDWGTLVYEDLWPGTGDYDFNDLVLDYQFKSVLNSQNGLVEFFTNYSVRALGASLHNGFAIQLGGDPSNVASVSGNNIVHNYLNINTNGTEVGQSETVIFLFDDSFDVIGYSGSAFINTEANVPYIDPDTSVVHVIYQTPLTASVTGSAPYNPFIVTDIPAQRGVEVHLPGQPPSDLVDTNLFGQWSDDTDPGSGKYYQTASNLPWALDIPVRFDYPLEQVDIINSYNHFVEWSESGGNVFTDWYEDYSGYRNDENIYSPTE